MRTNQAGIDLIKEFEGVRLEAYRDIAGIWTIGYGHTGYDVFHGKEITGAEAEALLRKDLERFENGISKAIGDARTTPNQFAAMVALAFNIGLSAFKNSSVRRYHDSGEFQRAADAFLLWNKSNGHPVDGLTRRRNAERALYLRAS